MDVTGSGTLVHAAVLFHSWEECWILEMLTLIFLSLPKTHTRMEQDVAAHSSILAWKIPQEEEPGGLQSVGSVTKSRTRTNTGTHMHTVAFGPINLM